MSTSITNSLDGNTSESKVSLGDRAASLARPVIVIVLAVAAIYYIYRSIHWPLIWDSSTMHYVVFLMHHGLKPYTTITDNNLPGAYYTEDWAMRIFGAGDLGWRFYDYFLLAVTTTAAIVIARPYDWVAGAFAGGLFVVIHAVDGPYCAGEREQVILALLMISYAAIFIAVRRRWPIAMAINGIGFGIAISIKPTLLPLTLVLLFFMALVLYKKKIAFLPYLAWAFGALIAIAALDLGFLLYYRALHGFLFIVHTVLPTYASMARLGPRAILAETLPRNMRALPILTIAVAFSLWRRHAIWTWEQWALAIGAVFGLLSYFAQGKGFTYHRYNYILLFFLLMGFELLNGLRQRGWPRALSLLTFALILFWIVPQDLHSLDHHGDGSKENSFSLALEADLQRLGGASTLQGKVQCFDLVYGCLNSLYHLRIVENTGFTGDLLFFTNADSGATKYYRNMFRSLAHNDPATMMVVSNELFEQPNSFNKIYLWPEFATYLNQNYTEVAERKCPGLAGRQDPDAAAYRIYIRNGTPLLTEAQSLQRSGRMSPTHIDVNGCL